jgi:L-aminopeptidase/D-esterase-like protein
MKGLTDIPGILVGHASDYDGLTGCTAILCESGAVAGGSAFGLEAASGVRRFLERKGVGFETGAARIPLVAAAILYDLGLGQSSSRPGQTTTGRPWRSSTASTSSLLRREAS